jgi:hypothetical protein
MGCGNVMIVKPLADLGTYADFTNDDIRCRPSQVGCSASHCSSCATGYGRKVRDVASEPLTFSAHCAVSSLIHSTEYYYLVENLRPFLKA